SIIPEAQVLWLQALFLAIGLVFFSGGVGRYIGGGFGSGPRDGLMAGLHRKFGLPIWGARTVLEGGAVTVGWLLGGVVAFGTLIFAVLIGPPCQFFIRLFAVPLTPRNLHSAGSVTGPVPIIRPKNDPDGEDEAPG